MTLPTATTPAATTATTATAAATTAAAETCHHKPSILPQNYENLKKGALQQQLQLSQEVKELEMENKYN